MKKLAITITLIIFLFNVLYPVVYATEELIENKEEIIEENDIIDDFSDIDEVIEEDILNQEIEDNSKETVDNEESK